MPATHPPDGNPAPGVYTSLQELMRLQYQAAGFSFLPAQPVQSVLAGRYGSRLRGRGLDFEELRQYRPGDDIRTMDWKVTRRIGESYVRVYNEERERPVLLVVDQRLNMFFGTKVNMKSVTAAETAALAAWRVVDSGDRVGMVLFNDSDIRVTRPRRSKKTVMRILKEIVGQNRELGIDRGIEPFPGQIDEALNHTRHLATHDFLVCIISDFHGLGPDTLYQVKQLGRHNDVILLPIYDPIARALPEGPAAAVTDGDHQMLVDGRDPEFRKRYPGLLQGRLKTLTDALAKFGVPILPIHTAAPAAEQIRQALGIAPGRRPRSARVPVKGSR